jgi:hypothetical protein
MSLLVMRGLILGYVYSILLSASAVITCEVKAKNDCSVVWSQAYAVATGLVTTFMAYFVQPEQKTPTRREEDPGQPLS